MVKEVRISIKEEFSDRPSGAKMEHGSNSGEEFLNRFLKPHFGKGQTYDVIINMDGVAGYAGSWIEEVFKGIIEFDPCLQAYDRIQLICRDDPEVVIWALGWMVDVLENQCSVV